MSVRLDDPGRVDTQCGSASSTLSEAAGDCADVVSTPQRSLPPTESMADRCRRHWPAHMLLALHDYAASHRTVLRLTRLGRRPARSPQCHTVLHSCASALRCSTYGSPSHRSRQRRNCAVELLQDARRDLLDRHLAKRRPNDALSQ